MHSTFNYQICLDTSAKAGLLGMTYNLEENVKRGHKNALIFKQDYFCGHVLHHMNLNLVIPSSEAFARSIEG